MARREEELNGPAEGMAPQPVDWAKMSERFERDRETRMSQFGEPARQSEFGQRRPDLEPVIDETPTSPGADARDLTAMNPGARRAAVSQTQFGRPPTGPTPVRPTPTPPADKADPLLTEDDIEGFRSRWPEIKAVFVDDPRASVQQADGLVEEVAQLIVRRLTEERARLEGEWSRGDVSTEDLRQSLHHYSMFFERLMQG